MRRCGGGGTRRHGRGQGYRRRRIARRGCVVRNHTKFCRSAGLRGACGRGHRHRWTGPERCGPLKRGRIVGLGRWMRQE